jgi:SAM-dependent methyltransferase
MHNHTHTHTTEQANSTEWPEIAPIDFWEDRYGGPDQVWSGKVNKVLSDIASTLTPSTALDLGCGEGGDVIWLAQNGWQATGIDISTNAVARATAAAEAAGVSGKATFLAADLATVPPGQFDLVTASFFHSPVELPRVEILREATTRVAPGGHLLITSHADFPPYSQASDQRDHRFLSPEEELTQLNLDPSSWESVITEKRSRMTTALTGEPAPIDDVVVLVKRR